MRSITKTAQKEHSHVQKEFLLKLRTSLCNLASLDLISSKVKFDCRPRTSAQDFSQISMNYDICMLHSVGK
jgi:hypothetical protein